MSKLGSSVRADRSRIRGLPIGIILASAVASAASAGPPTFQQIDPTTATYVFAPGGDYTQYFSVVDDVAGFIEAVDLTLPPMAMPTSASGCGAALRRRRSPGLPRPAGLGLAGRS